MATIEAQAELQLKIENRKKQIETVCTILKGPLSNLDRAFYVADRKELREELACLQNELAELKGGD